MEAIDNRADFKQFMQNYQVVHGLQNKGPRREGPEDEGFVCLCFPEAILHPLLIALRLSQVPKAGSQGTKNSKYSLPSEKPIFGVDLAEQMSRDNVEVPTILEKCAAAIEAYGGYFVLITSLSKKADEVRPGLQMVGIYRLSGTTSKIQKLKAKLDHGKTRQIAFCGRTAHTGLLIDVDAVDLMTDEATSDINNISGVLKQWFRELPEPLLTHQLYSGFIDAASKSFLLQGDRLYVLMVSCRG